MRPSEFYQVFGLSPRMSLTLLVPSSISFPLMLSETVAIILNLIGGGGTGCCPFGVVPSSRTL